MGIFWRLCFIKYGYLIRRLFYNIVKFNKKFFLFWKIINENIKFFIYFNRVFKRNTYILIYLKRNLRLEDNKIKNLSILYKFMGINIKIWELNLNIRLKINNKLIFLKKYIKVN